MKTYPKAGCVVLAMAGLVAVTVFAGDEGSKAAQTADAIRREALRPNGDPEGLPLPLAANWNTGWDRGISPKIQMELIEQGHYLLPWINMPPLWEQAAHPNMFETKDWYRDKVLGYYQATIQRLVELNLPFTIATTQWESALTYPPYKFKTEVGGDGNGWPHLPGDQNPNVVTTEGKILRGGAGRVSPFGPVGPWREVGQAWTTSPIARKLQEWYPNPPLVMFLSNNEHGRLDLDKVEMDRRYLAQYGKGKDNSFKSQVLEKGFTERMLVLQQGMRDGMTSAAWKQNALFCGYEVVERPYWRDSPEAWDGGSPSYYNHDWLPMTDYQANSAAIATMPLVTHLQDAYQRNPKLWWEISLWDGGKKKVKWYRDQGQTYDPPRYEGFTQFGMWLHRPRVVREYRNSGETWGQIRPCFEAVMAAVDRVHNNPTLRAFWRRGQLVQNRANPYLSGNAKQYQETNPWFLLDTSLDPAKPWTRDLRSSEASTALPVFALALVQGKAPARQWLVYAHAPLGDRKSVEVTIPEYKPVTVDVKLGGSFHLIDEAKGTVVAIARISHHPASARPPDLS